MKDKTVYMIRKAATGEHQSVYSRSYHDVFEFSSASTARSSNCHDIFKDAEAYKIERYRVEYHLIDDDCDLPGKPDGISLACSKGQHDFTGNTWGGEIHCAREHCWAGKAVT